MLSEKREIKKNYYDNLIEDFNREKNTRKKIQILKKILVGIDLNNDSSSIYHFIEKNIDNNFNNRMKNIIIYKFRKLDNYQKQIPILLQLLEQDRLYYRSNIPIILKRYHRTESIPELLKCYYTCRSESITYKNYLKNLFTFETASKTKTNCIIALINLMEKNELLSFLRVNIKTFTVKDKLETIKACRNISPSIGKNIIEKYFIQDNNWKVKKQTNQMLKYINNRR